MDKRKVIILAIVLFLFIGLGTFVFAQSGSDENGNGQGNNTIDTPNDNGGDNGQDTPSGDVDGETEEGGNTGTDNTITAGGNGENEQPGEEPNTPNEPTTPNEPETPENPDTPVDNTKAELLAALKAIQEKIDNADALDDIDSARVDRTDELVSAVEELDDAELNDLLDEINRVLDDSTKPLITPEDLDGSYNNATVAITISDDTATNYTLTLNSDPVENPNLDELTEEGTYTLTVTDEAFNEITITFTIDTTDPVLFVNDEEVENGATIYVNKKAEMTVDETNLESFTSNGADRTENVLNGSWTAANDGTYNIVVTDKAGNTTSYKVVVDKTPIEVNHLYVLNNSHNDYNVSDANRYKVIGNGQELYVEYVLKEEFTSTPVITIGGKEFEMTCGTASWDDSLYKCDAHITITEDMNLTNGEEIPFTITGVKDEAQNETIVTEKDVTVTDKYGKVIYDNAAPVYNSLGLVNITHYIEDSKGDNLFVANVGDTLRVMVRFDELLEVAPKVTLGGVTKEMHLDEEWADYSYWADIKITEDMDLSNDNIDFVISGYADAVGNVGKDLTSANIKNSPYTGVEFDTTAPDIKLNGLDTVYVKLNDEYNDKGVTISDNSELNIDPTYVVYYSETGEDGTFTTVGNSLEDIDTSKEGQYNVWYTATDAAGNASKVRRIIIVKSLEPFAMGVYGGNKVDDTFYVKDDTKVYFNLQFDELLAVSPKVDINGEFAFQYGKPVEKVNSEGETYYIYSYVYVINSDVSEGLLSFRIYDYEDQYGIVGNDITNEDFIGNGYQNGKIVVDRTAPDFDNLVDNSEDFAVSLGVTDDAFAYIELINQDTGRVIKEERYWTSFSIEGTWTAQVFDKAGNASAVYTFTIKPLVATAVINGQNVNFSSYTELFNAIPDNTETDITINKSTNEDMVIPENKIINIDLNGNTLSGDRVITNNGTINEISNGTIESTNNGIINNGSIGSIDNVTIDVYRTGINNKGKIDQIVNSTIEANYYPIYLSGTASVNKLAGNTVTGHYMDGIYVADESTINEIVSGNYTTDGMSPDGQTAGFGLYISSKAKVELISGGTFKGSKAAVANYGTIESIVGGIFEEKYTGNAWDPSTTFLYDGYVNSVSGGKFFSYGDQNEIFDRRIDFELAEGYEFVQVSDNYYEVQLIQN